MECRSYEKTTKKKRIKQCIEIFFCQDSFQYTMKFNGCSYLEFATDTRKTSADKLVSEASPVSRDEAAPNDEFMCEGTAKESSICTDKRVHISQTNKFQRRQNFPASPTIHYLRSKNRIESEKLSLLWQALSIILLLFLTSLEISNSRGGIRVCFALPIITTRVFI